MPAPTMKARRRTNSSMVTVKVVLALVLSAPACLGLVPTSLVRTSQLVRSVAASSPENDTEQQQQPQTQSPQQIAASFLDMFRVKRSKRTHVLSKKTDKRTPEQLELLAAADRQSSATVAEAAAAAAVAAAATSGVTSAALEEVREVVKASDMEPSYQIATDLVNALVDYKRTPNKILRIESLLNRLTSSSVKHEYDPMESLFGPLYTTLYTYTPGEPGAKPPLWEQLSTMSPTHATNIKGQQYYTKYDDQSQLCGSFINYSEIWGQNLHLRASGEFVPVDQDDDGDASSKSKGGAGLISNFFPKRKKSPSKTNLRTCPDIYKAQVTSASLNIFGQQLQVPVSGSSYAVILYADPRVRVFLKPASTSGAEWESKGVIACQVRSDLANKASTKIDLR